MEEVWRDIPGFENLYQASSDGKIRTKPGKVTANKRYGHRVWQTRIVKHKSKSNKRKDAAVTLWKDGVPKDYLVSRLVAMAWVDGYEDGLTVNHIDGNPTNNNCSNLEWITRSENVKKGFEDGLYKGVQLPVVLLRDGVENEFASMAEASRFLGRNSGYIHNCLRKGRIISDVNGNAYAILTRGDARQ